MNTLMEIWKEKTVFIFKKSLKPWYTVYKVVDDFNFELIIFSLNF